MMYGAGLTHFKPIRGRDLLFSPLLLVTICLCIMPMLLGFQAVSSQLMLMLDISAYFPIIPSISSNITHSVSAVGYSAVNGKSVSHQCQRRLSTCCYLPATNSKLTDR